MHNNYLGTRYRFSVEFIKNSEGEFLKQGYALYICRYIVNLTAALSEPSNCVKLPVRTCLEQRKIKQNQHNYWNSSNELAIS